MTTPTDAETTERTRREQEEAKWFGFAERLPPLAYAIFTEANIPITEKQFADPKILAIALLCRTLSNFKGVIAVAKLGMVAEARILTRSCYENLFCICGLVEKGDEFVAAMHHDEIRSMCSRGEFLLEDFETGDIGERDFVEALRKRLKDMKDRWPKARLLNPKEAVRESVIRKAYLIYSTLSGDSAHPSITALKRYLVRFEEGGEQHMGLDIQPLQKGTETADTVNLACNALIGERGYDSPDPRQWIKSDPKIRARTRRAAHQGPFPAHRVHRQRRPQARRPRLSTVRPYNWFS